jgi:cardiolipin synthase
MRGAGIDVRWFRQELGRFNFRRHRLRRLHRKLVVVDGRMGFVGGINIINDISPGANQPRLDYAVEVVGPVVHDMHAAARRLWALVSWSQLRRRGDRDALPRQLRSDTRQKVSFLLRDNFRHRRDIERAYLRAIGQAQHEIVLANAYFLPGRKFRNALVNAAKREGVRVVVLLQGRVDHWLQHYATRALYGQLLHAGVEIYEYHASFLHAKVAVVDGHWATVGSSNIDPLSLLLAREGNLVVRDKDFAAALRGDLMSALTHGSHRVQVKQWRHANPLMRLLAWMSYGVVRLLAGWGSHVRGREL